MSGLVTTNIKGMGEFTRALKSLNDDMRQKGAELSTRAGAAVIHKAAKEKVPVLSGCLQRTLNITKMSGKGSSRVTYFVTHKKKGRDDPWYAHIVEFGGIKGEYRIKPKKKKALADRSRSGMYTIYGKNTRHPKSRAKPYMRPAFYENADLATDAMAARLNKYITTFVNGLMLPRR